MKRLVPMLVAGVGLLFACAGREIVFKRMDGNASPRLTQTIKDLRDGDTLRFEKGNYHFHLEGTTREYLVTAGCWNGEKDVVFLLDGLKNVTVDGGGSTFYWHGRVFPFHVRNCENLNLGNFTTTLEKKSVVELSVVEKSDEGFLCQFKDPSCYRVEDRRILFDTDIGLFSTAWAKISMHALNRSCINYLFAGDCTNAETRVHMPAPHLETFAEDRGDGKVYFRYRDDIPGGARCPYQIGEPMCFLLEIPRFRITYLFDACRNVVFHDATVRFGGGIALTAQLCENLRIERYKVKPTPGNLVANTADCMFLVNCRGQLEVKDCEITRSLDDAFNCHGCYLKATKVEGRTVRLQHVLNNKHYDGFFPYHVGDEVEFTHPQTRAVLGIFKVAKVGSYDAYSPEVDVTFEEPLPSIPLGAFAEDLTWIPDVTITGCHFHDTLHLRLSGRGKWRVENNRFERFGGILIDDLAAFWGESGWVRDMTIRRNHFSGGGTYVSSPASSPRRHQGVRIVENTYEGGVLASLPGVANAEVRDNVKRAPATGEVVLFDAATADPARIHGQDGATFALKDGLLTVTTAPSERFPGFTYTGDWDVSGCGEIEVEFVNGGIYGPYTVRLLNANAQIPVSGCYIAKLPVQNEPHAIRSQPIPPAMPHWNEIVAKLTRVRTWALPYLTWKTVPPEGDVAWGGGKGGVAVSALDSGRVKEVAVYINKPKLPHTWSVRRIVAKGAPRDVPAFAKMTVKEFFPFVDEYGQFKHREWPDKIHSDADLAAQRAKEERDLAAHPGPKGWDKWGGWADGPQLPKTGGFTTTKWNGKWWIVDPDGHLWWSHGPVRVTPSCATTALDGHADWFARLPGKDEPEAEFYSTRDQLLFPYYARWNMHQIYDFSAQNIARKYGENWYETWADLAHRRLRSWGCNTIANSSDKQICLMHRTPYTDRYEIHSRPLAGHKGGWWDFCDPFDPSFRAEAHRKTVELREQFEDPWCFGFFVDNEHAWGDDCTFAESTLKSPADQPCKKVFRERMRAKYGTVAKLNAQWKTAYGDWDDFLAVTTPPERAGAKADLQAFTMEIAEAYYRIIGEELKKAAPGKLYLGCRWAGIPPEFTVRAAAKYCDVISYNIYRRHLRDFKFPEGVDKPVLVGEFHFGALDRGPFCPGLILLRDQNERARVYEDYVRSALAHPLFVGVHWHQFSDQAISGRFDGENMQVGWTDVCDTPYWETIGAIRKIGSDLYRLRAGK